uniref:Uncharacterized protein n=1 Tax=Romanomermis culicivorax TaxID=13658 RepID=A0A915KLE7_ROMCU
MKNISYFGISIGKDDAKSVSKITPLAINERTSKVISDIMIDRRLTNAANATISKKKGRRSKDKQTVGKPRASGMINPNGQSTPKKRRSADGTFGNVFDSKLIFMISSC